MTTCKEQYTDNDGLIITASQHRLLERRKMVASLYKELRPKYASVMPLYEAIMETVSDSLNIRCTIHMVIHDLRQLGFKQNKEEQ